MRGFVVLVAVIGFVSGCGGGTDSGGSGGKGGKAGGGMSGAGGGAGIGTGGGPAGGGGGPSPDAASPLAEAGSDSDAASEDANGAADAPLEAGADASARTDAGSLSEVAPSAWACTAATSLDLDGGTNCIGTGLLRVAETGAVDVNARGDIAGHQGLAGGGSANGFIALVKDGCTMRLYQLGMLTGETMYSPMSVWDVGGLNARSTVVSTVYTPRTQAAMSCNGHCYEPFFLHSDALDTPAFATAINDHDVMIGSATFFNAQGNFYYTHAILWPAETSAAVDLTPTLLQSMSVANAINNAGQVVGAAGLNGQPHAVLWQAGTMIDLGTLGGTLSTATGINEAGDIIGISETATMKTHGFIWRAGQMQDLGTLGGDTSTVTGMNASGQVVGTSFTASHQIHAFLWQAGTMTDLGTLGGTISIPSSPYNLGGDQQQTWRSAIYGAPIRAAFLNRSPPVGFNRHAINDAGQIVGTSTTATGDAHPFLWQAGTMRDLDPAGGAGSEAVAINAFGQVAGNRYSAGLRDGAWTYGSGWCH